MVGGVQSQGLYALASASNQGCAHSENSASTLQNQDAWTAFKEHLLLAVFCPEGKAENGQIRYRSTANKLGRWLNFASPQLDSKLRGIFYRTSQLNGSKQVLPSQLIFYLNVQQQWTVLSVLTEEQQVERGARVRSSD